MKILVDKMPEKATECLFFKNGKCIFNDDYCGLRRMQKSCDYLKLQSEEKE